MQENNLSVTELLAELEAKIIDLLKDPYGDGIRDKLPADHVGGQIYLRRVYLRVALNHLRDFEPSPQQLAICRHVVFGTWDTLIPQPDSTISKSSYELHEVVTQREYDKLYEHLYQNGELSYELFAHAMRSYPDSLWRMVRYNTAHEGLKNNDRAVIQAYSGWLHYMKPFDPAFFDQVGIFLERLLASLDIIGVEEDRPLLLAIEKLSGSDWLLKAAHLHHTLGLEAIPMMTKPYYGPYIQHDDKRFLPMFIAHLCRAREMEPADPLARAALLESLKGFPPTTLKALLPITLHGRKLLLEALGWDSMIPFVNWIEGVSGQEYLTHYNQQPDIPNSPEADSGVIDLMGYFSLAENLELAIAKEIVALFEKAEAIPNTLYLMRAILGDNRAVVEKAFANHSQVAIKAYGLLPLEDGPATTLVRYVKFQESAKAGKKFGPQRRVSHAAAVQVGLQNLAQRAGYPNLERLEWEMELQLGQNIEQAWDVSPYALRVELEDITAKLVVYKEGKPLKSIPKAVRDAPDYAQAQEAVSQLRQQVMRFRKGFLEQALVSGIPISLSDVQQMTQLAAVRAMLEKMILRTPDGFFGLLAANEMVLYGLQGEARPLTSEVIVAHPYHLYQAGLLAEWQQAIVHRQITQPLKQAFRELYLLTPAELETGTFSRRFAGHHVVGSVAGRLLGSRDWRGKEDYPFVTPYKSFGAIRAVFEVNFIYFMGSELDESTGVIYFQPQNGTEHLPLTEVDPLIFSEVMRDADLVVSVAQYEGGQHFSNETYERRAEVITSLLKEWGLAKNVQIEGHFAFIKGKLASYRVHLASAVIHIEPGNYLCIVPKGWGEPKEKLFLPFADDQDSMISVVVSKILLLLNDDKIKDESILQQIRRTA